MDKQTDLMAKEILAPLELEMQELEAMEAPGFWEITAYVSGAVVSGGASYVVVTVSISTITIT